MIIRGRARPLLLGGGIGIAGFAAGILLAWAAVPLAALAAAPEPAAAQGATTIPITVYGEDPCPKGDGGTIIVCARRPESERYRLPRRFRGQKASPASNAWGNKVHTIEDASRVAAGLPDTCSAVGSGGQSGCYHQFLQRSRIQRQADASAAAAVP